MLMGAIKFIRDRRQASSVQNLFRESNNSYREFLNIAERRAIEVLPDYRLVWQNAYRLQNLLLSRTHLRFEYLKGNRQLDSVTSRSIASIEERLDKAWTVAEEAKLKERLPLYREISCEIDDIKSKWDPLAISAEMISALERDSEYRKARIALSEGAQKRQAKLGSEIGTA
jgi:hypothetical protein